MSSPSKNIEPVAVASGCVATQTKDARVLKIAASQPVSKTIDIQLDAAELRMILAYRSLADECQELLFDLTLSTSKRASNLRHKATVLRLLPALKEATQ